MKAKSEVLTLKDSDGKEVKVRVKMPGAEEHQRSQIVAAKAMKSALSEGVLVKSRLNEFLEEQGLWDKQKEDQANKMAEEIRELEVRLANGVKSDGSKMNKKEGKDLALEIKKKRAELDEHLAIYREHDDLTVENIVQNAKFDYLVYSCTYDDDTGNRMFTSYEDYKSKNDEPYAIGAAWQLAMMLHPVDKEYDKKLVENQFLTKYGFVNDDLRLVNENGKLVDSEGRLIDENGNYVTEDGQFCDRFGNLISKDGFIELTADYND